MAEEYPAELELLALHLQELVTPHQGSLSLGLRSRMMVHQPRRCSPPPVYDPRGYGQKLVLVRVVWVYQEVCFSLPLVAQLRASSPRYGGRL
jgi:hypothetical protein